MLETFIALLAAHFLADFPLQSDAMVKAKRRPLVLLAHIAIVTAVAAVTIGWFAWPLLAIIAVSHLAMDAIKLHWLKPGLRAFFIDQAVHIIVIAGMAIVWPDTLDRGAWALLPDAVRSFHLIGLVGVSAVIAAVAVGGLVTGKLLEGIVTDAVTAIEGLPEGGKYIGWLERGLTLLFVAIDQPTGVGLLLAAKSILRFGDISDSSQRARAEYIMIGTFLSVGWALVVAVVARGAAARLIG